MKPPKIGIDHDMRHKSKFCKKQKPKNPIEEEKFESNSFQIRSGSIEIVCQSSQLDLEDDTGEGVGDKIHSYNFQNKDNYLKKL